MSQQPRSERITQDTRLRRLERTSRGPRCVRSAGDVHSSGADRSSSWGYRFYFWSRENQEPPHIHVDQAERYAKFWLTPVSLADSRGFRSNELGELRRLVETHRDAFEEKWHEHLRSQGPPATT